MANTYTLINSTSLSSSAASVTFSSIPATYDDLCLVASVRTDRANVQDFLVVQFNSDTAANYSYTALAGTGAAAQSINNVGDSYSNGMLVRQINGGSTTSNSFGNLEFYVPSYRVSQKKPSSSFGVNETNATNAYMGATANLWQGTSAITTINLSPYVGPNFVSGSTFWLYGIKNS